MNSFERFSEKKLPDKEYFYGSLKDGEKLDDHVSDKEYLRSKKLWNALNMKNMVDYHDHYLKKDVLLLVNVFEKFIDTCLTFYKLHLCHYFSSPGLSWDTMLKMTGIISGIDMYLFLEKGLSGGISYICKRQSEANNKYINNYDPTKLSKFISHLDMNSLYGWLAS